MSKSIRHSNTSLSNKKQRNLRSTVPAESSQATVQEVMTSLLLAVGKEINEMYYQRESIHFVVHCAQRAFTKLLKLHFYRHNPYEWTLGKWKPDSPTEPSRADTWAVGNQAIMESDPDAGPPIPQMTELESFTEEIPDSDASASPSLIEDVSGFLSDFVYDLKLPESSTEVVEKTMSAFTMIAQGYQPYPTHKSQHFGLISNKCKLPKIDLERERSTVTVLKRCPIGAEDNGGVTLPPIRTDASSKCHLEAVMEVKTKSKNKR